VSGETACCGLHEVMCAGRELAARGGSAAEWREYRRDRATALSAFALETGSEEALAAAEEAWRAVADTRPEPATTSPTVHARAS
jgi:hypothetical protein